MQTFYDLKIASKLIIGFVCVLILTSFLGLFSITQLSSVSQINEEVGKSWMPSSIALMGMKESISRMRSQEAQVASADTPEDVRKYQDRTNEAAEAFKKYHAAATQFAQEASQKTALAEALSNFNSYQDISNKIIAFAKESNGKGATELLRSSSSASNKKLRGVLDKMIDDNMQGGQKAVDNGAQTFKQARILILVVLFASIMLGLSIAIWLARVVSTPLQEAVDLAQAIAQGDLRKNISAESRCETGQLIQALSDMNSSLVKVVNEVRGSTVQIKNSADDIAHGNNDLSSRTDQQANSLENTVSSMNQITTTLKHNSDNARQANVLSQNATTIAEKGGQVVSEVVATMSSINESSRKIVDIISVIDGIAFQTNILALNAAVEAARAGEQGRGFAVVASEVRNLAQRSASAAKEIKELINDSVEKVGQGSRLVDSAGSTMKEVVESVKRVSNIISEITDAGHEQSSGVEQINHALLEMDQATQQNATLVQQATASATTMQEHAEKLVEVVSVFKLDNADDAGLASKKVAYFTSPARAHHAQPKALSRPRLTAEENQWEEA